MTPDPDPKYFNADIWSKRRREWIDDWMQTTSDPFVGAQVDVIISTLESKELSARVVVNIGADSLLKFLRHGRYRNCYEIKNKPIPGEDPDTVKVSPTRLEVDRLIGFGGAKAETLYFGAVELSGSGVRFYGEYCMVLSRAIAERIEQVFDRNSYDVERPPLKNFVNGDPSQAAILRGNWAGDLTDMLILKVAPKVSVLNRLATPGTIADAVLTDEDFVEVHLNRSFEPRDLAEVRIAPSDETLSADIRDQWRKGQTPRIGEWLWLWRRGQVAAELHARATARRVVTTTGRTGRWS